MRKIELKGCGFYVPEKVLTNHDLEKMVDTSDEWITTRTGIKRRHIAENTPTSELAYQASLKALEMAGMEPDELDAIIIGTVSFDTIFPSTACWLQKKLGIKDCFSFDISAACSGFIYALEISDSLLRTNKANAILIIGADVLTSLVNWEDRSTCVLFGDGAGAVILKAEGEGKVDSCILAVDVGTNVDGIELLYVPAGGTREPLTEKGLKEKRNKIYMKGNEVFKIATRTMVNSIKASLKKAELSADDIDFFIPHQANKRIIDYVARSLKVPEEKVIVNLDEYGNTSAASIPIALAEAYENGKIKKGDKLCLFAFGAGFTYGSAIIVV